MLNCCTIILLSFADYAPYGDTYLCLKVLLKILHSGLCEQFSDNEIGS